MLRRIIVRVLLMLLFAAGSGAHGGDDGAVVKSLLVREMPLRRFAELLSRGCGRGWNVMVSQGAADIRVSLYLENAPVEEVLRAVCSAYGLWYRRGSESSIVQVMTLEEYRRGVNLYSDVTVEVLTIRYPSVEEIGDTLQRLFQDRVVWQRPEKDFDDPTDRIDRALKRMDLIADRATFGKSDDSDSSSSSTNSSARNRNSSRTSTNSRNLRETRVTSTSGERSGSTKTLDELAVLEQQKKALEALQRLAAWDGQMPDGDDSAASARRPGLVYISALPASNDLVLRSGDPASLARVRQMAVELDKPRPQVLLEVKVLEVSLDKNHARGIDWLFRGGSSSNPSMFGGGYSRGINADAGQLIMPTTAVQGLVPQGSGLNAQAFVFNLVTDDIRARLQLFEQDNRVTTLATPNLLVADNEASRVFIGTETTVLEKVESNTTYLGEQNITPVTTYTVEAPRRKIGTTLLITPKIHADRTVTIRLLQEDSSLGEVRDISYGTLELEKFKAQDVDERSVTTTVVASDGNIIVIGGLVREKSGTGMTGLPGLNRIPVLGELFKTSGNSQQRTELMVLIRPFVLLAPGEGEDVSQELLRRVSQHPSASPELPQLGVGARKDFPVGKDGEKRKNELERIKRQARVWEVEP